MRSLALSKSGINKIRARQFELKSSDFDNSIKSLSPGEWCLMQVASGESWLGFVNPLIDDKYSCAHLLCKTSEFPIFSPEDLIKLKIKEAHERRLRIVGYEKNSRLFYGSSDGLPGLIIDQFENVAIIQINTAGLDKFREIIKNYISELMDTPAYLLDNAKYREKESLPTFENAALPDLLVQENNLKYKIRSEVLQKVGFYYDHRENRFQLMNTLSRLNKKPSLGLDLFCYAGAWGMSALSAGVKEVHFIDQGNFSEEVNIALEMNGFQGRGTFFRNDVFKFLDEAIQKKQSYDIILCDPPAFAKSALQKPQALEGYTKLHRKVLKCIKQSGVVAFSSCTHYVGHEEFQKNILEAAFKENKKIQLIYSGIQGLDHPITSLEDKSSYIKCYFYIVE